MQQHKSWFSSGPGIFFILPCLDNYMKVDLRTVTFDVPPQEVRTAMMINWRIHGLLTLIMLSSLLPKQPSLCHFTTRTITTLDSQQSKDEPRKKWLSRELKIENFVIERFSWYIRGEFLKLLDLSLGVITVLSKSCTRGARVLSTMRMSKDSTPHFGYRKLALSNDVRHVPFSGELQKNRWRWVRVPFDLF